MISSLLHLVGLRPRVYYTLTNFRGGGGKAHLAPSIRQCSEAYIQILGRGFRFLEGLDFFRGYVISSLQRNDFFKKVWDVFHGVEAFSCGLRYFSWGRGGGGVVRLVVRVGWWRSLHDRVSRVLACKTSPRAKLESDR